MKTGGKQHNLYAILPVWQFPGDAEQVMMLRSKPRSTVTYPKAEPTPSSPDPHRWGLRMFLGKSQRYLNTIDDVGYGSAETRLHISPQVLQKRSLTACLLELFTLCLLDKLHWLSPNPLWLPGSALSQKASMLLPAAALCPDTHLAAPSLTSPAAVWHCPTSVTAVHSLC